MHPPTKLQRANLKSAFTVSATCHRTDVPADLCFAKEIHEGVEAALLVKARSCLYLLYSHHSEQ